MEKKTDFVFSNILSQGVKEFDISFFRRCWNPELETVIGNNLLSANVKDKFQNVSLLYSEAVNDYYIKDIYTETEQAYLFMYFDLSTIKMLREVQLAYSTEILTYESSRSLEAKLESLQELLESMEKEEGDYVGIPLWNENWEFDPEIFRKYTIWDYQIFWNPYNIYYWGFGGSKNYIDDWKNPEEFFQYLDRRKFFYKVDKSKLIKEIKETHGALNMSGALGDYPLLYSSARYSGMEFDIYLGATFGRFVEFSCILMIILVVCSTHAYYMYLVSMDEEYARRLLMSLITFYKDDFVIHPFERLDEIPDDCRYNPFESIKYYSKREWLDPVYFELEYGYQNIMDILKILKNFFGK